MTCDDSRPCQRWSAFHLPFPFQRRPHQRIALRIDVILFFLLIDQRTYIFELSIKREIGHLCCDEPPSGGASAGPHHPTQFSIRNIINGPSTHSSALTDNTFSSHHHQRLPITNRADIDPSISASNQIQPISQPFQPSITNPTERNVIGRGPGGFCIIVLHVPLRTL